MKAYIFLIAQLLFLSILFTACESDNDEDNAAILTGQTWKITTNMQDGADVLLDCEADDRTTFNSDGTLTVEDLGATCGNESRGSWEFSNGDRTLTLIDNAIPVPIIAEVVALNPNQLHLEGEFDFLGTSINFSIIYEPF